MNTQQIELARRVVSSERFRWMPGMLAVRIYNERKILTRLVEKDCEVMIAEPSLTGNLESGHIDLYSWNNKKDLYLDLEDPATIGCLVHLIRLAWKAPIDIHESRGAGNLWGISIVNQPLEDDCPYFTGYSQQEILVKAFEAAPASLEG